MSLVVILCGPFLSGSIGASLCHALALAGAGDVDAARALLGTLHAKAVRAPVALGFARARAAPGRQRSPCHPRAATRHRPDGGRTGAPFPARMGWPVGERYLPPTPIGDGAGLQP